MSNMNGYVTNAGDSDFSNDDEMMAKIAMGTQETTNMAAALKDRESENSDGKRKLEDVELEGMHEREANQAKEKGIAFYKKQKSEEMQSSDKAVNDGEEKLQKIINSYEELNNKYNNLLQAGNTPMTDGEKEGNETKEGNENMLNMLTNKEIENEEGRAQIEVLKINGKVNNQEDNEDNNSLNHEEEHEHLNTEEAKMMKEGYRDLEKEYENYKHKAEEKLIVFNEQVNEMQTMKGVITELEAVNLKGREEMQDLISENTKKEESETNKNSNGISEIEHLQATIHLLEESKNQITMNSKEEKSYIISERKEIESQFNQVLEQKLTGEEKFNTLSNNINKQGKQKDEEHRGMLQSKVQELDHLKMGVNKISTEKEELKKENEKFEGMGHKYSQMVNDSKTKYETEKSALERKITEIQMKCNVETAQGGDKVKEGTTKNEEGTKELQSKSLNKNKGISLENILIDGTPVIQDAQSPEEGKKELESKSKVIEELTGQIKDLKRANSAAEQGKAEYDFIVENEENLKKQIETGKTQREKDKAFFASEVKAANDEAVTAKCQLAMITFEKDNEILKWKKQLKRFQEKGTKLGFQIMKKK